MAGRILLLIIALPLLEIWLLIEVGSVIGALWTIILIIATTIIGTQLVRRQGLGVMTRARKYQQRGEVPAVPMLEGMALLIAGFCLILPGLITDSIGFLLLIPPFRSWVAKRLLARAVTMKTAGVYTSHGPHTHGRHDHPTTIEGDYERRDDD